MGISWDAFTMRTAIDRNDTRLTALFLQGGMNWQLAWTETAFAQGNDEVLQLLLRYPSLMDEHRPCRRFIATLGHAMAGGAAMTSEHKAYLRRFCTIPAVGKRQQDDAGQAQRGFRTNPRAGKKERGRSPPATYNGTR